MSIHKQVRQYRRASQGEQTKPYTLSLKPTLIAQVDKLATTQQVSRSEIVERFIARGLQQEES